MATGMIRPYMFDPESVCCTIPVRSDIDGTAPIFTRNRSANPVLFTKQSSVKWREQTDNVLPHQLERH